MNHALAICTCVALLGLAREAAAQPASNGPPPAPEERLRAGVSGLGGVLVRGPGWVTSLQGRIGGQLNSTWAVFAEPDILFGAGFGSGAPITLLGGLTAVLEATLRDMYFVAGGFGFQYGISTVIDKDPLASGYPTVKLRVGMGFGLNAPNRRKQFTIGLESRLLVSWAEGPNALFGLALGYDAK